MRTLSIGLALAGALLLGSCKKTWTCECKNANNTYNAGEIEATKSKAKKQCKNLSNGSTECNLK